MLDKKLIIQYSMSCIIYFTWRVLSREESALAPEQKQAWFIVGACSLATLAFIALIPFMGVIRAWPAYGLFGLGGLAPLFFRARPKDGGVAEDERDKAITQKATLAGGMCAYGALELACIVPYFLCRVQGKSAITIEVLPFVAMSGLIVLFAARAITLLALYGRGDEHDAE
jgi:hypothetical protein